MNMNVLDKIKERLASARGMILVEHTIALHRISICNSCEHLTQLRRCNKCGCFVDGKTKLVETSCPLNKW